MDDQLKILLCEDDENLGMLLREYLQAKGYNAELCVDGEAGYKAFLKTKFDICVLDVMMPKKDGFTLAQEIRQANAEMPIIFLTAKILKEDILEGFRLGADDYITKPFSMEELVQQYIKSMKLAAGLNTQRIFEAWNACSGAGPGAGYPAAPAETGPSRSAAGTGPGI